MSTSVTPGTQDEFVLDDKAASAIAAEVLKGIDIEKIVLQAAEKAAEKATLAANTQVEGSVAKAMEAYEGTLKKNIQTPAGENGLTKEVATLRAFKALINQDREALSELNKSAIEAREKAGYNSADISADGGYVVMQPDFEAEIEKLVPNYGVAFREATIVPVSGNTIWTNKRGSNVMMYEVTAEGGQKRGTKLTVSQAVVTLREFAAIAIVTNKLSDDAAIDFWQELTSGFAEARAQIVDQMVFTDSNPLYPGLLHLPGTVIETVGASITSVTWDDLLTIEGKLPSAVQANLKYYMHRTVWNQLLMVKDSQGRYQLPPFAGFKTPWGREVVLVDVMPSITSYGDANEGYIIVADLKRTKVYVKRGLEITISDQATVHDADGQAVNLFERNMKAMRAECRMIHLTKFPEAVGVIGTGTVS